MKLARHLIARAESARDLADVSDPIVRTAELSSNLTTLGQLEAEKIRARRLGHSLTARSLEEAEGRLREKTGLAYELAG